MISVSQAAKKMNISRARLYFLVRQGRVKAVNKYGRLFIMPAELERFSAIERRTGRPALNGKDR